jgi:mannose-6-phosphate isomerase-like protein (cupin superfamily)
VDGEPTFDQDGFLRPRKVLEPALIGELLTVLAKPGLLPRTEWAKSLGATVPLVHDVAASRAILDPVAKRLGKHVILWGASVVKRGPGQVHPFHTDIESSPADVRSVTVWIGLRNTTRESSLRLVPGSQAYGLSVQHAAAEAGVERDDLDEETVLGLAQKYDSEASILPLDMTNGEAVWFDGHLWHASNNTGDSVRTALLLQYASADSPIRIPDFTRLDPPFRMLPAPLPPCVVVRGDAHGTVNSIVPAPCETADAPLVSSWIRPLEMPLGRDLDTGWRPHPVFGVSTPNVSHLTCHVSVLESGMSPHPPHTHVEEEILIVIDGEAELILERGGASSTVPVRAGDIAYYPNDQGHTLRGTGSGPVTYLMLKWRDAIRSGPGGLETTIVSSARATVEPGETGMGTRPLFQGPTTHLGLLHTHVTAIEPGAGYEPHVDAHDVVLIALNGVIEVLDQRIEAPAAVLCSGGWPHGMHNPGTEPARYLVVEFHRGERVFEAAPESTTTIAPEATPPPPPARKRRRSVRVAVWRSGGRLLRPFPRTKAALKRLTRRFSPWVGSS